jgi:hypothetical protein
MKMFGCRAVSKLWRGNTSWHNRVLGKLYLKESFFLNRSFFFYQQYFVAHISQL